MTERVPDSGWVASVGSATRVGSELRWPVVLTDGRPGCLAQLLPELSRDDAVRRRYLGDLERRAAAAVPGVAELIDRSPADTAQPWRLRVQPQGMSMARWLETRAPAPVDEVAELGARVADILHTLHERGVVVRDLHPRSIVLTDDGPVLTDIGLARVDLLSTRTAASLVLEGSPYASPEQLRKTVLDQRSDLYGLGVMLWNALTGTLPYGDEIALLVDPERRVSLSSLRRGVPSSMADCVERCVDHDVERRPNSAGEVAAVLRGEAVVAAGVERVECQNCGERLLLGQRLCLACGREGVAFRHVPADFPERFELVLRKVKEDVGTIERLRGALESVSAKEVPVLNFISGDQRMYSKRERARRLALPVALFSNLSQSTAWALAQRMEVGGTTVSVRRLRKKKPTDWIPAGVLGVLALLLVVELGAPTFAAMAIVGAVIAVVVGATAIVRSRRVERVAMLELRRGPAALPASDPWVARLARLCGPTLAADVRERVGELALTVQRLVDHRASLPELERREVDVVSEPIEGLVTLIETEVERAQRIDLDLQGLDEGALARRLAQLEARGARSEAEPILQALDRLRVLEEARARALHRLLEAGVLLRRAAELGLGVRDGAEAHQRQITLALAALGPET